MTSTKKIAIKEALTFGWQNWSKNWHIFFILSVASIAVNYIDLPGWLDSAGGAQYGDVILVVEFLWSMLTIFVQAVIGYATVRYAIATSRGEKITLKAALTVRARPVVDLLLNNWLLSLIMMTAFFPIIGALISLMTQGIIPNPDAWANAGAAELETLISQTVTTLTPTHWSILAIALIIGLIAMTYFGVMFWASKYAIVQEGIGPVGALKRSAEITQDARGQILLFGTYCALVLILGCIAFGVGLLIAIPVIVIASAHVYGQLARQTVSAAPAPVVS